MTHTAPPRPSDECGIVAQIAGPLAAADISAYYISTFKFLHTLVPEENISALKVSQAEKYGGPLLFLPFIAPRPGPTLP